MPSAREEIDQAEQRAFALGKAAGEASAQHELAQLRTKNAQLAGQLAKLRATTTTTDTTTAEPKEPTP